MRASVAARCLKVTRFFFLLFSPCVQKPSRDLAFVRPVGQVSKTRKGQKKLVAVRRLVRSEGQRDGGDEDDMVV